MICPPPKYWPLLLLGLAPTLAQGELPMPVFPECGATADHGGVGCPNDFGDSWNKIHYIKSEYADGVRTPELAIGSGMHLDKAFAQETGDFQVTVAVFDSGILWDEGNVRRKWRLNAGELPLPQGPGGVTASSHDYNGDGIFNIDDYNDDPRVDITDGEDIADHMLEPSDLIAAFSDSVDDDGNGYIDDICGWDFLWNDNNAFDASINQGYSHGTLQTRDSVAEGNDGGRIGACPNCSVIPMRVGSSFIANSTAVGHGLIYAADNDVQVVQAAVATMDSSAFLIDAMEYAYDNNVTFIASAADETSIHANQPGANPRAIVVHPISMSGSSESDSRSFLHFDNCSNFGARLGLSISTDGCSSEATSLGAGLAGLLYSAALHEGIEMTPGLAYQLLTLTADDVDIPENYTTYKKSYPSEPGWDRYFGYGRVNINNAINALKSDTPIFEAEFTKPEWFQTFNRGENLDIVQLAAEIRAPAGLDYSVEVFAGLGLEPSTWELAYRSAFQGPKEGQLHAWSYEGDLDTLGYTYPGAPEPLTLMTDPYERYESVNKTTITLLLKTIVGGEVIAKSRRVIYITDDPDLISGFPKRLPGSLEGSPTLADLDGDGVLEIIQTTTAGEVYALRGDGSSLPGFPVKVGRQEMLSSAEVGNHLGSTAFEGGAMSNDYRQLVLGAAAVGDLDGDGDLEIVAATEEGYVHAWHHTGVGLSGFPVSIDRGRAVPEGETPERIWERGIFSSPALGDLDGDGTLEIVVGAMDQQVYAWTFDGALAPGWPVAVGWEDRSLVSHQEGRIMVTPAIGDLDGDGMNDVIVGTNEQIDFEWSPTYAIHGDGERHRGGPYLTGWPIKTFGLFANLLPDIGAGTTSSPALADLNGDGLLEVATHTVASVSMPRTGTFYNSLGRVEGRISQLKRAYGEMSNVHDAATIPLVNSGAFGDIDQDGDIDYAIGMAGSRYLGNLAVDNKMLGATFSVGAWDAKSGDFLPGFPQQVTDMQLLGALSIADISGDGLPEVISGTGAFTVHAFDKDGLEPEGWPKMTGQWVLGTPAIGDITGDGYLEVVVGTRSGYLFVWRTQGLSVENGGVVEWGSFHGDAQNSGVYRGAASSLMEDSTPMGRRP